jgi:hypothetical protein
MKDDPSNKQVLIQYRIERAQETLPSAQVLHQQGQDSASIVNRAYNWFVSSIEEKLSNQS